MAAAKKRAHLAHHAAALGEALAQLDAVLSHLASVAEVEGAHAYLADATVFLEFFGIITIGWQWLLQAVCAARNETATQKRADRRFYAGKRHACDYFFKYELPKTSALSKTLMAPSRPTLEVTPDQL
jgi:butyryl-CoA dehydrogenase